MKNYKELYPQAYNYLLSIVNDPKLPVPHQVKLDETTMKMYIQMKNQFTKIVDGFIYDLNTNISYEARFNQRDLTIHKLKELV